MDSSPRIAIVAQGGVFPGVGVPWADPAHLWRQILAGQCAARTVPAERWGRDPASLLSPDGAVDTVRSLAGCFVEIESETARDPVVALTLRAGEMAWARAQLAHLDPARIGVILGHIALPTDAASRLARHVRAGRPGCNIDPRDRYVAPLPAVVLRERFNLGGPAYTLDAACASSLYALKLAADELRAGRVDAMLAGGVSRPDCLYTQLGFTALRALSAAGVPRPFDAAADGLVVGEGAGVFVLKRLDDALRAGDTILATIAGVGLSNDVGGGLLAPSSEGQLRAMRAAYERAGWRPDEVALIECHATGTPVGDAVEVRSLRSLWERPGRCVLGSVKSNVGHLLTAAGSAGLVKVLHALGDGVLPPTANLTAGLDLSGSPFRLLTQPEDWPRGPRRAAISGFGFGGINAHLLLEAWAGSSPLTPNPSPPMSTRGERGTGAVAIVGVEMKVGNLSATAVPVGRFRIPPRELDEMLPQQRLILLAVADLLDGVPLPDDRARVGMFLGVELDLNTTNFTYRWSLPPAERDAAGPPLTANRTMGALASIAASRVAREFRIGGPSHTFSSGTASGLDALRAAVRAVQAGEVTAAVVGAVDLPTDERSLRCLEGDGPVVDAVVALLVEPLTVARATGRKVLAVVGDIDAGAWHSRAGAAAGLCAFVEALTPLSPREYTGGEGLGVRGEEAGSGVRAIAERPAPSPLTPSPLPSPAMSTWGERGTGVLVAIGADDVPGLLRELTALRQQPFAAQRAPAGATLALAFVARDAEELRPLIDQAEQHLRTRPDEPLADRIFWSPRPLGGQVAFVFPGSGNDYPNMGQGLLALYPDLVAAQERAQLAWDEPEPAIYQRIMSQVAVGCLVCAALTREQVRPAAALGISLGESAALFSLGAWTDRAGMFARLAASSLFRDDLCGAYRAAQRVWGEPGPVEWTAGVVRATADAVRAALVPRAYLLIITGPGECVLGGESKAVAEVVRRLRAAFVPVRHPTSVHCAVVNAVADRYRDFHRLPTTAPAGVRFYSGATGRAYHVDEASAAAAIVGQALTTLDLPALIEQAYADGVRLFVEIGPGASATRVIARILGDRPHRAQSVLVAQDEAGAFLRGLAMLTTERAFAEPVGLSLAREVGQILTRVVEVERARGAAHAAYLRQSAHLSGVVVRALAFEQMLTPYSPREDRRQAGGYLDREQCLTFAIGRIADVLGPDFAEVDTFPTRVRLPDEPLMLVDRILSVAGEPRSLTSGRVVTEKDVRADDWYLDAGRMPTSIAVESGQADLFLSGYLGIDFATRGQAVYRLLDAEVTFHRGLPGPGAVIRYDIRIEGFFRQGATYLFRFAFDGTVDGAPLLTMRKGVAGFFTAEELAAGKGVVQTALDRRPLPGQEPDDRSSLAPFTEVESYDEDQVEALRRGDLEAAFGPAFAGVVAPPALRLPGGRLRLVHRVERVEPRGGRFGLGRIRGAADIHPDDWFLTCHFVDDQVMPGTLMYECCLHTLRLFLLRLGWVGEGAVVCEPVPGVASQLRCRGQVTATTRTVTYEVVIKERGYGPEPYVIGDALMYADGKAIVEIQNLSLRLTGLTEAAVRATWTQGRRALYGPESIRAFAVGKPSEAFGEPYRVFDAERVIARLPGPPYQFLDRISHIEAEPWQLVPGGVIEAAYDVPPDAWYFAAARQPVMPFAVLLEVALQPCGWLAAYLGSALTSPVDLSFRNLGGEATLHRVVTPDVGTLTTRIKITQVSRSGGMIIQGYDFAVRAGDQPIYEGTTMFGFFTKAALAQQVGLRDATPREPDGAGRVLPFPDEAPFPDSRWRMVDRVELHGADLVRGFVTVDPTAWFFAAHFYQDPVWPGSLGLEALLQLLQAAARERWGLANDASFHTMVGRHQWVYRGQVIPTNREVLVQAEITHWEDAPRRRVIANGFLAVDGRLIYRMTDFTVDVVGST